MDVIMNATIGQIIGGICGIIAALSVFIEITPIKINPVSDLLDWMGRRINHGLSIRIKELDEKVDKIAERQDKIEKEDEERDIINCRVRILRFSDEIRRNMPQSYEGYEQVFADMDKYENYCKGHENFKNHKTAAAEKLIRTTYEVHLERNDFL